MSSIQDPIGTNSAREPVPLGVVSNVPARPLVLSPNWQVSSDSDAGGLLEYARMLWRRKFLLLVLGLTGAAVGFSLGIVMPKTYRSHASLEIQGRNDKFLNLQSLDPISSDYSSMEIETQVSLLQNRLLSERVLRKMLNGAGGAHTRSGSATPAAASPTAARAAAFEMAASSLQALSSERTRIVDISSESTDPKVAAEFLNSLVNEFIDQGLETRWSSTQRTSGWLTTQLQDLKKSLEASENELLNYARGSALVFTNDKDTVAEQKLRELQAELSTAQADRIAKQSRYELAKSSPPDSLPDFQNDVSLRGYETTLTDLRRQLADLSSSFTPEHYKVKRVQAQISEIEAALRRQRQNVLRRIQNDFEEARRRQELLAAAYGEQSKLVVEQASTAVHYNMLKREVDASKQLYDSLTQQLREAAIGSAMHASTIRIVEPAVPSMEPARPMPVLYSALGFATALFLGSVFTVIRQRTDPHFHAPGDAAAYLSVPELGVIPAASADPNRDRTGRTPFGLLRMVWNGRGANHTGHDGRAEMDREEAISTPDCLELVTWQRKPSLLAESFRATLASLLFAGEDVGGAIVITSPEARDGKTTMTTNLAIALAETKRRVLLIDGDMRRPRLHSILAVSNSWGLSDVLREPNPIQSYPWAGLMRETSVPNLWVLPAGPGVVSAANLLYSPRLQQLLERARKAFDLILIDTPPMLDLPDARILGQAASGVILVLRAGRTTRDVAMAARIRLAQDNTRVIGTVLNDWDAQGSIQKRYYERYSPYHRVEAMG